MHKVGLGNFKFVAQVIFDKAKLRFRSTVVSESLIEPLEERLLYSADHPLGLAISFDTDHELQDALDGDRSVAIQLASGLEPETVDSPTSVAFIDSSVTDHDELSNRLIAQDIVVHTIDSAADGIEQVSRYLTEYSDLESVLIFSHSVDEGFALGSSVVNGQFLPTMTDQLADWSLSLSEDADLMLFGCDLAADLTGRTLLNDLAAITQADVAASEDTTGHVSRGGNWELEWRSGVVNSAVLDTGLLEDWQGSLASITVTTDQDVVDAPDLSSLSTLLNNMGADNAISLREAVLVANIDSSVSLITLAADTTYGLDLGDGNPVEDGGLEGDLDLNGTYTISGGGAAGTVIEQDVSERVVHVLGASDITLSNLSLVGGADAEKGGGLYVTSGAVTHLDQIKIIDNYSAKIGGGIANEGMLYIVDTTIEDNEAVGHGGGIHSNGALDLDRVTIYSNDTGGHGGGIHQTGKDSVIAVTSTLDYVTISGNTAVEGGAIRTSEVMTIQNSTLVENTGTDRAGAIRSNGGTPFTLKNSVVASNVSSTAVPDEKEFTGLFTSQGFNYIENAAGNPLTDTDIVGNDPRLASIAYGTGEVQTHALQPDSPLINRGGSTSGTTDASGILINAIPDIGAHESQTTAGVLYFTNGIDKIYRSDANVSQLQLVLDGLDAPLDVELDAANGRLYWLEKNTHNVRSAFLDGTDVQTHFAATSGAVSLALDIDSDHVYIASVEFISKIRRYVLSTGTNTTAVSLVDQPTDVEFDPGTGMLYWLDTGGLGSPSLNVKDVNSIAAYSVLAQQPDVDAATGLALNSVTGQVYWVDSNSRKLGLFNPDVGSGSSVELVNTGDTVAGVAYDTLNDRVIATTGTSGSILSFDNSLGDQSVLDASVSNAGAIDFLSVEGTTGLALQTNNGLSLDEGELKEIDTSLLLVSDPDTATSGRTFTITVGPNEGEILVGGRAATSFTQEDVDNGDVSYQDSGTRTGTDASWTDQFTFTVTDGSMTLAPRDFVLTVSNVDEPPSLSLVQGISITEGESIELRPVHFYVTDNDSDDATLRFSVSAIEAGSLLVNGTQSNSFSYADLLNGSVVFEHAGSEPSVATSMMISLTDGTTTLPAEKMLFSIVAVDDETPLARDHDLSGDRGDLISRLDSGYLTLMHGVSDADEPVGTLSAGIEIKPLHGTVIIKPDGTFSYLHDGSDNYTDSFTYTISDAGNNTSLPATVNISIAANSRPVVNGFVEEQSATELQPFSLTLDESLFTDSDVDDTLVWQAALADSSALPDWLAFDTKTLTFTGIPADEDTGTVSLMIQVSDNSQSVSQPLVFTLTVNDINQPPTLQAEAGEAVMENQPGSQIATVTAGDPDKSDTVTVSVDDPRFLVKDGRLILKVDESLDYESEPELQLLLTATDNTGESVRAFLVVEIQDNNDAPVVITNIDSLKLNHDESTVVPADWVTDQDDDPLNYSLSLANGDALPDWIVYDDQSQTLSLGDVPQGIVSQSVLLTVSDGRGGVVQWPLELLVEPDLKAAEPITDIPSARGAGIDPGLILDRLEIVSKEPSRAEVPTISKDSENSKDDSQSTVVATQNLADEIIPPVASADPVSVENPSDRIKSVKQYRVISEQIDNAIRTRMTSAAENATRDILNNSVSLSDIFGAVQSKDVQTFDALAREFERQRDESESAVSFNKAVVGSSITVTSGLSVGYLVYLIRGGAIVSSMLSSLPAWRFVDPLPILGSMSGSHEDDTESLVSIVDQQKAG